MWDEYDSVNTMVGLARLYTDWGYYDKAEDLLQKAQDGWKEELGKLADDRPETLTLIHGLGVLRREQQHYSEAECLLQQALEGRQRKLGEDLPPCGESKHEPSVLSVTKEDYDKAEPLLLDAFQGRGGKLGRDHPHTLNSLKQLVSLYDSWPKPDEATKWRAKLPRKKDTRE